MLCWVGIYLDKLRPVKLVWGDREVGEKDIGKKDIGKKMATWVFLLFPKGHNQP